LPKASLPADLPGIMRDPEMLGAYNILMEGARAGKSFEWAQAKGLDYGLKLPEKFRAQYYHLAKAPVISAENPGSNPGRKPSPVVEDYMKGTKTGYDKAGGTTLSVPETRFSSPRGGAGTTGTNQNFGTGSIVINVTTVDEEAVMGALDARVKDEAPAEQ
jgi:hypothetical protein